MSLEVREPSSRCRARPVGARRGSSWLVRERGNAGKYKTSKIKNSPKGALARGTGLGAGRPGRTGDLARAGHKPSGALPALCSSSGGKVLPLARACSTDGPARPSARFIVRTSIHGASRSPEWRSAVAQLGASSGGETTTLGGAAATTVKGGEARLCTFSRRKPLPAPS